MTRLASLSLCILIAGVSLGADANPFAGKWVNMDADTRGITRLSVETNGDEWEVEAWGSCQPKECEWGKTQLHQLGDSVDDKEMKYGFAHWDSGHADTHVTFRIEKGRLMVETYTIFKDKSERSSYRSKHVFRQFKVKGAE